MRYGASRGLFDLDLEVAPGEIFGFLGPNGAGKTTAIKLLMGLSYATRGTASIFGMDVKEQAVEIKRRVGYVPGELPQFGGLRASEVVAWMGGLRGELAFRSASFGDPAVSAEYRLLGGGRFCCELLSCPPCRQRRPCFRLALGVKPATGSSMYSANVL